MIAIVSSQNEASKFEMKRSFFGFVWAALLVGWLWGIVLVTLTYADKIMRVRNVRKKRP